MTTAGDLVKDQVTDAEQWAAEFWKAWGGRLDELNEDTMHTWFACAIQVALDSRDNRAVEWFELWQGALRGVDDPETEAAIEDDHPAFEDDRARQEG